MISALRVILSQKALDPSFAPKVADCLLLLKRRAEEFQQAKGRAVPPTIRKRVRVLYREKYNAGQPKGRRACLRCSSQQIKYFEGGQHRVEVHLCSGVSRVIAND